MDIDEVNTNADGSGVTRAASAYQHFSKAKSSSIKDELIAEGKDATMGSISQAVSAKWKSMTAEEKAPYEEASNADKARYQAECLVRDAEVAQRQEENRRNNAVGVSETTDSRIRGSTIQQTDQLTSKLDVVKKPRAVNLAQKEATDARRKAKAATEDKINAQLDANAESRAIQAENRLKFLLQQSDIFSHFGVGKEKQLGPDGTGDGASAVATASASSSSSSSSRGHRQVVQSAEMDEEEAALAAEEGGEDDGPVLLKQPPCITGGTMREYQLEGLNWMIKLDHHGINGILADEMGLGKTLQSISMLAYLRDYKHITGPHLIIVPKSTLSNWGNELRRFCPDIRVMKFHGTKDERQEIVDNALRPDLTASERSWDVCITTYEVANLERNAMNKMAWRYLIIDEAHRIKNEDSQFSRNVRMLNTEHRLLLTGTPLQNNLHELWALLNYLLPDVFASSEQFDEWFNLDVDDVQAKQRMISQLHKLLRPFMLRRLKADVEGSLLPKKETVLFTGMSATQKQLYRQILLRDIDVLQTGGGTGEGSRTTILNIVMQLRKCCNHPYLFPGIEDRSLDPLGDHIYETCGKMVLLDKLLMRLKQRQNRVLIFSQMTKMIDILEDYCISKGYSYCRIDGNTTYEEREDRIQAYNAPGSEIFIFLLSTRAGGLGINLQTADTVILYDSDWNPQADLQAQDRAHRIGQKKQVHVFRLVTDDTVEVKVVERAQQKLKLDAMVVQQGRLVDKEKKLSKDDLMETLRFGADKIFRSKESGITDDDIDTILEQGQKRTDEMLNSNLTDFKKGDMYDFKLDGGRSSNTQIFEGKDYSDKANREGGDLLSSMPFYIDVGKRERKAVQEYYNPNPLPAAHHREKDSDYNAPKVPRHLRLPRMEDWQFYDRARLIELSELESKMFDEAMERKELIDKSAKCVILPPELHEEKQRLLDAAFSGWTKMHFNNFARACARYGRNESAKIAKDIGRPVDEVARYADVFFTRGADYLSAADMERIMKQIEKGERRLEEIQRLTDATGQLINMFANPWEELTFKNVGNVGRIFNSAEDRYLLCLTQLHGFGSWDMVRASIRRCERFRFDYFLQSCSAETLGKRCEMLMKSAERELLEIEKKQQQVTLGGGGTAMDVTTSGGAAAAAAAAVGAPTKDSTTLASVSATIYANQERLKEVVRQIALENKHLANARSALQKLSQPSAENTIASAFSKEKDRAGFNISSAGGAGNGSGDKQGTSASSAAAAPSGGDSEAKKTLGAEAKVVPEELLPELARMVVQAGMGGIANLVTAFTARHPTISKRQTEMKINELAEKDKRPGDTAKVWHIRPEFERYLTMGETDADGTGAGEAMDTSESNAQSKKKTPSKSAAALASGSSNGGSLIKRKREEGAGADKTPASKKKVTGSSGSSTSGALTPLINSSSHTNTPVAGNGAATNGTDNNVGDDGPAVPPKRFKRAFGFFVKARRGEVESQLQKERESDAASEASADVTKMLKDRLMKLWNELGEAERDGFSRQEAEDKARYELELKRFVSKGGDPASL